MSPLVTVRMARGLLIHAVLQLVASPDAETRQAHTDLVNSWARCLTEALNDAANLSSAARDLTQAQATEVLS